MKFLIFLISLIIVNKQSSFKFNIFKEKIRKIDRSQPNSYFTQERKLNPQQQEQNQREELDDPDQIYEQEQKQKSNAQREELDDPYQIQGRKQKQHEQFDDEYENIYNNPQNQNNNQNSLPEINKFKATSVTHSGPPHNPVSSSGALHIPVTPSGVPHTTPLHTPATPLGVPHTPVTPLGVPRTTKLPEISPEDTDIIGTFGKMLAGFWDDAKLAMWNIIQDKIKEWNKAKDGPKLKLEEKDCEEEDTCKIVASLSYKKIWNKNGFKQIEPSFRQLEIDQHMIDNSRNKFKDLLFKQKLHKQHQQQNNKLYYTSTRFTIKSGLQTVIQSKLIENLIEGLTFETKNKFDMKLDLSIKPKTYDMAVRFTGQLDSQSILRFTKNSKFNKPFNKLVFNFVHQTVAITPFGPVPLGIGISIECVANFEGQLDIEAEILFEFQKTIDYQATYNYETKQLKLLKNSGPIDTKKTPSFFGGIFGKLTVNFKIIPSVDLFVMGIPLSLTTQLVMGGTTEATLSTKTCNVGSLKLHADVIVTLSFFKYPGHESDFQGICRGFMSKITADSLEQIATLINFDPIVKMCEIIEAAFPVLNNLKDIATEKVIQEVHKIINEQTVQCGDDDKCKEFDPKQDMDTVFQIGVLTEEQNEANIINARKVHIPAKGCPDPSKGTVPGFMIVNIPSPKHEVLPDIDDLFKKLNIS